MWNQSETNIDLLAKLGQIVDAFGEVSAAVADDNQFGEDGVDLEDRALSTGQVLRLASNRSGH